MEKVIKKSKYSCFVYGEGRKDRDFLKALIDLEKFRYHTQKWSFNYGNASGSAPRVVLMKCKKEISGFNYDLILCFIDLDKLKQDFPKKWKKIKTELEKEYSKFKIIWQIDNLEGEHKKVIGNQYNSKHRLNRVAKQKIREFINSDFWKRILDSIRKKEQELDKIK